VKLKVKYIDGRMQYFGALPDGLRGKKEQEEG